MRCDKIFKKNNLWLISISEIIDNSKIFDFLRFNDEFSDTG